MVALLGNERRRFFQHPSFVVGRCFLVICHLLSLFTRRVSLRARPALRWHCPQLPVGGVPMLLAGPRLVFTLPPNNPLHRTVCQLRCQPSGELRRSASKREVVRKRMHRGAKNAVVLRDQLAEFATGYHVRELLHLCHERTARVCRICHEPFVVRAIFWPSANPPNHSDVKLVVAP